MNQKLKKYQINNPYRWYSSSAQILKYYQPKGVVYIVS